MSQPIQPIVLPEVIAQAAPGKLGDGTHAVQFTLAQGTVTVALLVSPEQADQLATLLADVLTKGAAASRRAKLGLLLPGQPGAQMPTNGHPGPRRD